MMAGCRRILRNLIAFLLLLCVPVCPLVRLCLPACACLCLPQYRVFVYCGFGGRADHMLSNMAVLYRWCVQYTRCAWGTRGEGGGAVLCRWCVQYTRCAWGTTGRG